MDQEVFNFQPTCSARGCGQPASYKVAAPWSDGRSRELKNYGLACEAHRDTQLASARAKRDNLHVSEGESVGQVSLYQLAPGKRDAELSRIGD